MEKSTIFTYEGVILEFAVGYRAPTTDEWIAARKYLDNPEPYIPPQPPLEHTSRVESELRAEAGRFAVIHGNVATLPELYIAVATLQVWSSRLSEPQYVIAPEKSEPG